MVSNHGVQEAITQSQNENREAPIGKNTAADGSREMERSNASATPEEPDPTDNPTEGSEPVVVTDYYVVFKVTQGNMSLGQKTVWQGVYVTPPTFRITP